MGVERVKNKSNTGKKDTLNLAKKVNELQAKIKDETRKMMACVSELSMQQAEALRLQQEVKERENDLEQSYIRMEKGEAPSEDIAREWMKMVRNEDMREREREMVQMTEEEEEQYRLAGGNITTAEHDQMLISLMMRANYRFHVLMVHMLLSNQQNQDQQ